jgi:hypothetical protein
MNMFGKYNSRLVPLLCQFVFIPNTVKKSMDLRMKCPTANLYYLCWYLSLHGNLYLFSVVNELLKGQILSVSLQAKLRRLNIIINSPLRAQHMSV